jgi:1-acyl-sn-glycerol-3-phosphate acyltransferase
VRRVFQIPFFLCVKVEVINASQAEAGGCILACTHLGHLESPSLSILMRRRIDWMARTEFFRSRAAAWFLRAIDAFPVQRHGVPVRAIRTAIVRARGGRAIGVFPEGGVARGADSVCRGGPIKRGTCLIAMAAQAPIIPVVVLGVESLSRVDAWLPVRRGRLWVIFGEPLIPPPFKPGRAAAATRRAQRAEMAEELRRRFMDLYADLRARYQISEREVP